jgi:hypothetical protein
LKPKRRPGMSARFVVAASTIALVAVAGIPSAFAETTRCIGTPIAGTTMLDNVKVPRGATCTLSNVKVKGNIKVGPDATLVATNVNVKGSVQAKEYRSVTINGASKVGGSIQLIEGGEAMTQSVARINGTRVKGEIQLDENFGSVVITNNRVNGDVQLWENAGASSIATNLVGGNLQCKENLPEPVGAGNMVKGNAEDQCEDLVVASP